MQGIINDIMIINALKMYYTLIPKVGLIVIHLEVPYKYVIMKYYKDVNHFSL